MTQLHKEAFYFFVLSIMCEHLGTKQMVWPLNWGNVGSKVKRNEGWGAQVMKQRVMASINQDVYFTF